MKRLNMFSKLLRSIYAFTLSTSLILIYTSCQKEQTPTVPLVDDSMKELTLHGGSAGTIPIQATDWKVNYVRLEDPLRLLRDTAGVVMEVNSTDTVSASGGWLRLAKSAQGDSLFFDLKENFADTPRTLLIGLHANGQEEVIRITQRRPKSYKITNKKITELEEHRKIYKSDHECTTIVLSNNTSETKRMEADGVFRSVKHVSTFESDDYGAFDWIHGQDSLLFMQELIMDGKNWWSKQVPYRKGTLLTPYLSLTGSRTLFHVDPYTNITVSGEMTYVERVCQYTFTIQNEETGHTFNVSGIWRHTLPLIPSLTII
ncbi:hypothetical protein M8998_15485 [Sphingobacterium sp. lm-10]|uniref:hypothetical protein n=1 Tax=Sphingobacterium sp. lm-10 TaxID=2944904 RepID=UPI002021D91D|nr:hypothetical protein [Sphingobacterium sp. lm-10]MCL7989353.1 hypothetical protein [Sphingobacterium sp. lm-10]